MNYTRLIFHHVPKSGGTSICQAMKRSEGITHKRLPFAGTWVFSRSNKSRNAWSSHFAFDPVEFNPTKVEYYFTVIRHPLSVIESGLKYYRAPCKPHELFKPDIIRKSIQDMLAIRKFDDIMVRASKRLWDAKFPCYYYEGIRDNLNKFHFVGICEEMEKTMSLLSRDIGVRLSTRHSNRTDHERREFPRGMDVPAILKPSVDFYWECVDRLQSMS